MPWFDPHQFTRHRSPGHNDAARSPDHTAGDKRPSKAIPVWLIALGVPPIALIVLPLYIAFAFVPAGTRSVQVWHVHRLLVDLYALYAPGYALFALARSRISRDVVAYIAVLLFVGGLVVFLFSFGLRTIGGITTIVAYGGLMACLSLTPPLGVVDVRLPTSGSLLYSAAALFVPLAFGIALATWSYSSNDNPAAELFGTVWLLFGLYALGYILWSSLRALSPATALFTAAFSGFWGFPLMMVFASLGPISLVIPVAAVGGVAASLPYLWSSDPPLPAIND
jgi:hypothetical protein